MKLQTMKVLILGHTGMLGSMVKLYLEQEGVSVECLYDRFDSQSFKDNVIAFNGDYIINCIGAIPQRTNRFKVNTDLPIWLSNNATCKVVHVGTDCELDKDPYGISKKLASDYIQLYSSNTKILQTSIIGPEQGTSYGLMEWFLSQEGEVNGYTKAIWNGNTTLEWAKQCYNLLLHWEDYVVLNILEGESVSKYEMLCIFKEHFNKSTKIIPVELGQNKNLTGNILTKDLKSQLLDLKNFLTINKKHSFTKVS
jgi:dTDP-4-dehydrorhamnose reductase